MTTERNFAAAVLLAALAALPMVAHSQGASKYPAKTIRIICAYPAGSTTDIVSRMLAAKLQASLGQPVVVENQSGASGNVGTAAGARAAPDGYTFVVGSNGSMAVGKALYKDLPYDPEKDLAPVSMLISAPYIVATNAALPVKTFQEYATYARARPGKLAYASIGQGTGGHLLTAWMNREQKLEVTHVPYRGWNQALLDVVGGSIHMMVGIAPAFVPHVKSGKLHGLAVTSPTRRPYLPELPTIGEVGLPRLEANAWFGLAAPGGTPQEIVTLFAAHTARALKSPDVLEQLGRQSYDVVGNSPQEFAAQIRADIAKWTPIIEMLGIKPE